jgi:hypothetical protein
MKWRVLECVLVLAILAALTFLFPGPNGSVHYFSPDSLQSKYRPNAWLFGLVPNYLPRLQDKSSPLVDHLVKNGYWAPSNAAKPRWIVTAHFSDQWKGGQSWLHRPLYWDNERWIAWTEANPEMARLVWPQFLASLRREDPPSGAYELLLVARYAKSVDDLHRLVQDADAMSDELKASIINAAD